MLYTEFLEELKSFADEDYRTFHKRLLKNDDINVLGVRVPQLRKIAKKYISEIDTLIFFPDDYYEITFVKLTAVSCLKYEDFIKYVDLCVPLINNWAACDCFKAKCIEKNKESFLPYIRKYAASPHEFYQRYALTTLLHFYVEEKYLEEIFAITDRCDTSMYYVQMAAAWLIAETLAKYYDRAKGYLLENSLDKTTHNKAIQKACESSRLSNDRKNFLKGIKR